MKALIASIECQMNEIEFTDLIEDPSTAVLKIKTFVKKYQLQGVEIKCDNVVTSNNKDFYTKFLRELKSTLNDGHLGQCPITVSVRIPVDNLRLNETYNVGLLNSLHHVALESFEILTAESQLVSPLFSLSNDEQTALDTTIDLWLKEGLKREILLINIPSYGIIKQTGVSPEVQNGQQKIGETIKHIVTQKKICKKIDAYTISPTNETISFETQATLIYKMRYAVREGFAGIGFMSLNDDNDDGENTCNQGSFPLLQTINSNLCPL